MTCSKIEPQKKKKGFGFLSSSNLLSEENRLRLTASLQSEEWQLRA